MSQSYYLVCDKCGQPIITKKAVRTVNVRDFSAKIHFWDVGNPRGEMSATRIDLCPECAERFVNWLESEVEE